MRSVARLTNLKPVKYQLGIQPRTTLRICFPEANPFAKKVGMGPPKVGFGIGSKNPVVVGPQKSLHKSETFFEKVEAAEMSADLSKRDPESLIVS